MAGKYSIEDFSNEENNGNWSKFILEKECIIFGKNINDEPLELSIHKNQTLENSITKINEYINWLGNDCKEFLINVVCEHINSYSSVTKEELLDNEWYESLEIYRVLLTVTETGEIGADINCGDNYEEGHILDIGLLGKNVTEIVYDG